MDIFNALGVVEKESLKIQERNRTVTPSQDQREVDGRWKPEHNWRF